MNTTIVVLTAMIFGLVGTLVFAAVAPYLSTDADATIIAKRCPLQSPEGKSDIDGPGCSGKLMRSK
jgi:hypothetical protein